MKRNELLQAIKSAMPGVDKTGQTSLGTNFLLFDENWIRSFNDTMSISYPIETGVKCAVKAEELFKILGKMSGDSVQVALSEDSLVIKDQKTRLKMTVMEQSQFDQLVETMLGLNTDNLKYSKLPEDFDTALSLCIYSASDKPELTNMAGVSFSGDTVIATDNHRASDYTMAAPIPKPFALSVGQVTDLSKLEDKLIKVSVTDAWVHFQNESGLIISCRKLAGEYPTQQVLDMINEQFSGKSKTMFELPEGLESAIDRAEVLAGSGDNDFDNLSQITLTRKGDLLFVNGKKDVGTVEDKLAWKDKQMPENIELSIPPSFLKKILSITRSFRLSSTKRSILFEAENFRYLMIAKIT